MEMMSQIVLGGQFEKLFAIGAVAVLIEDLAEHAGGHQARHPSEVDSGFGMAGAAENAAFLGHQRKQVPRPVEVARLTARVDNCADRRRVLRRP